MGQLNGAVGQVGTFLQGDREPDPARPRLAGRALVDPLRAGAGLRARAGARVRGGAARRGRDRRRAGGERARAARRRPRRLRPAGGGEDRVRDADRGRARAAARARVRPDRRARARLGRAAVAARCRCSSPGSCSRRRRSAPSESSSARSRARRERRRSSRSSSRCRSRSSRSSRSGTAPVVAWIGALFPFGHAVHAFTVALYDTHPAGLFLRECVWLAALALAYGLAARDGGAAAALTRGARAPAEPARTVPAEVTWPRSESCGPSPRSSSACGAPARPS